MNEAEKDEQVGNPVLKGCNMEVNDASDERKCQLSDHFKGDEEIDGTHSLPELTKESQTAQISSLPLQPSTVLDPADSKLKILGVAPMLDVTTREFRQLMRILSKELTLWTEMVVDGTILHAKDLDNHLGMDESLNKAVTTKSEYNSHPIVCQIGGNSPQRIYAAVQKIIKCYDYDEININMGCPSQLVAGKNMFGAVLMKHREVAKAAVEAMKQAVQEFKEKEETESRRKKEMRLSVKCRIGVDDWDSFELLREFIQELSPIVQIFYIHARKAVLGGKFTTKQNRAIPPLNYPWVYALCEEFPNCEFHINGGIPDLKTAKLLCYGAHLPTELNHLATHDVTKVGEDEKKSEDDSAAVVTDQAKELNFDDKQMSCPREYAEHNHKLQHQVPCRICQFPNGSCVAPPLVAPSNLRGCMLGRAARDNPCLFWDVDRYLYGKPTNPCQNRWEVLAKYLEYIEEVVPPRCCDANTRDTRTLPMPFQVKRDYDACPVCANYGPSSMWTLEGDKDDKENLSVAPSDYNCGTPKPKISSHVFSRVLRPLIGIMNGVPNARKFRQEFDRLLKQQAPHKGGTKATTAPNSTSLPCYRNCGPAVVIRMALLRVMDREVLMQDFETTEEISVDYSRSIDCLKGKRTW